MKNFRAIAASAVTALVVTIATQAGISSAFATSKPSRVVASEVRIVDAAGRTRAILGVHEGEPTLHLYSKDEVPQFSVVLDGASSLLTVNSTEAKSAVTLIADKQGARLGVGDSSGFVAVNLSSNHPGITISNAETKAVSKLSAP